MKERARISCVFVVSFCFSALAFVSTFEHCTAETALIHVLFGAPFVLCRLNEATPYVVSHTMATAHRAHEHASAAFVLHTCRGVNSIAFRADISLLAGGYPPSLNRLAAVSDISSLPVGNI